MDETSDLIERARQARRDNRLADAKRDLEEAIKLCRLAGAPVELAEALTGLGQIERDLQHNDAGLAHYEEAVEIYRAHGNAQRLAHTIRHVADIHRHARRYELADTCYEEALGLYRAHGDTPPLDLANALRGWAILKEETGHAAQARVLWLEAKELYTAVNVEAGVAESKRRLERLEKA